MKSRRQAVAPGAAGNHADDAGRRTHPCARMTDRTSRRWNSAGGTPTRTRDWPGGALDRLLGQLAEGVMEFRTEMGPAWASTIIIMTEFGRTARPNGTRGTDHGTAGAGFIVGPTVKRSAVFSDWPGLGDGALFEPRPEADAGHTCCVEGGDRRNVRSDPAQAARVFPGSDAVRGAHDLMG